MSCEQAPTLAEFAPMYVQRGGFGNVADVDELERRIKAGCLGSGGPTGYRFDTLHGKVTLYAGHDHDKADGKSAVLVSWTCRKVAEAALGVGQGSLL